MQTLKPRRASSVNIRFPLSALGESNLTLLSAQTGINLRTLNRWKTNGVPLFAADRIAVSLGTHPALVWPDWYQHL